MLDVKFTVPINIWPASWITSHKRNHGNDGGDLLQHTTFLKLHHWKAVDYLCTINLHLFFCMITGFFPQTLHRNVVIHHANFSLFFLIKHGMVMIFWNYTYEIWVYGSNTIWTAKIKYIPEQIRFASSCSDKE